MAYEHYDSGRTHLFEQASFNGSFEQHNTVDERTSPNSWLTPYNVVYLGEDAIFLFGGGYGDRGGTMVEPAYGGRMYYLAGNGTIIEFNARQGDMPVIVPSTGGAPYTSIVLLFTFGIVLLATLWFLIRQRAS